MRLKIKTLFYILSVLFAYSIIFSGSKSKEYLIINSSICICLFLFGYLIKIK